MKVLLRSVGVTSLILVAMAQAFSQDLKGADAALRQVAAARGVDPKESGGAAALLKSIDDYTLNSRTMSAAQAAAGWLSLFDQYAAMRADGSMPFVKVVGALPAPESWSAIATGLRKRTAGKKGLYYASLDLLAEVLRGDVAAEWRAMAAIMPYQNDPQTAGFAASEIIQTYRELARQTGDKARLVRSVTMQLAQKLPTSNMPEGMGTDGMPVSIPDLVTLVGAQEAERILVLALTTSSKTLIVNEGKATRALAQRLALANVGRLKAPQWNLIDVRSTKLYEALAKRFPSTKEKGFGADQVARARYLYVFGLLLDGRRAEALKIARTLPASGVYYYRGVGDAAIDAMVGTREFTAFLGEVVAGRPNSPFWDQYVASAVRSGESAKVVSRLQAELAAPKLTQENRSMLQQRLSTALFAADRVDEALALMKKQLVRTGSERSTALSTAVTYARIGHLLNRPALVEEGIAAAKRAIESTGSDEYIGYADTTLIDLLMDLGRSAEAEKLTIESYARSVRGERGQYTIGGQPNSSLIALAKIYYRMDRPADVRALLDRAPDWGVKDAADLVNPSGYYESDELPIGFVAAWALFKTGEKQASETILNRVLSLHSGFDPAYALLRELKGVDAIPRLDAIYAADQFQERPLIWKAVALKDAGRLPEAEETIRKAIGVDPSDGETHGGHRMYAYTVLADILAAKGDAAGAAEYRSAVAAIRVAENADEFAQAGLLTRAIARYKESVEMFSAAYCIQSRLAVDLMEQGRVKEAEEHYRRAYELMPSSFGRVETHCMGCEHVFEGEIAQNIAERVFTQLAAKNPEKPQVHYLLGYLRSEQGMAAEAMASYRKAVALDPDYLNAWKQMSTMSETIPVSVAERNAISNAILRLDPLQKHGEQQPIGDPREIWRRVDKVLASLNVEGPVAAYPLSASALAIAKLPEPFQRFGGMDLNDLRLGTVRSSGAAVALHPLVSRILGLIDQARMIQANSGKE